MFMKKKDKQAEPANQNQQDEKASGPREFLGPNQKFFLLPLAGMMAAGGLYAQSQVITFIGENLKEKPANAELAAISGPNAAKTVEGYKREIYDRCRDAVNLTPPDYETYFIGQTQNACTMVNPTAKTNDVEVAGTNPGVTTGAYVSAKAITTEATARYNVVFQAATAKVESAQAYTATAEPKMDQAKLVAAGAIAIWAFNTVGGLAGYATRRRYQPEQQQKYDYA